MKRLSDVKEKILFRRARVKELRAKGLRTDTAIAKELGCSRQTVNSDLRVLRRQAETETKTFHTKLPFEYDTVMEGVVLLLKKNWEIFDDENAPEKARANASRTILSCYNEMREQLKDKFNIMDGMSQNPDYHEPSLEEKAVREANEQEYRRRQAVF